MSVATERTPPTEAKTVSPAHLEKLGLEAFAEDGGIVDRAKMERKLLWKLDLRFR